MLRDLNDVAEVREVLPGIAELRPRAEDLDWLTRVHTDQIMAFFASRAATVVSGWRFVDLNPMGAIELPPTSNPNDLAFHGHPGELVMMSADNIAERTRRTVLAEDRFVVEAYQSYLKAHPNFFTEFMAWLEGVDDDVFKEHEVLDWRNITSATFPDVMMQYTPIGMCARFPEMMQFMTAWVEAKGGVVFRRKHAFDEAFVLGDSRKNHWLHGALGSERPGGSLQVTRFTSPLS